MNDLDGKKNNFDQYSRNLKPPTRTRSLAQNHVTDGFPLQRPRYAPHPSYACTTPTQRGCLHLGKSKIK